MSIITIRPPSPEELVAYAAQKRWEAEVGGITVNGLCVHTDDRSKIMVIGARNAAQVNPNFTTEWKAVDGTFVTLDAAAIIAVSDAVLTHLSRCFEVEASVLAGIGGGAITSREQIDSAFLAIASP